MTTTQKNTQTLHKWALNILISIHYNHFMTNKRFWYDKALQETDKLIVVAASNLRKSIVLLLLLSISAVGQKTFHNCTIDGGTGNVKGYQSVSEIYACDEGRIELEGRWTMTIEYGYLFRQKLGRPDGEPYRPSAGYLKMFKWCNTPKTWDKTHKELCGLVSSALCLGDWTCQ